MSSLKTAVSVFSCCGSPLTDWREAVQERFGFQDVNLLYCLWKEIIGNWPLQWGGSSSQQQVHPWNEIQQQVQPWNESQQQQVHPWNESYWQGKGFLGKLYWDHGPLLSKLHFSSHTKAIHLACTAEKENPFSAAVANLRKLAKDDEIVDIQITGDGIWSRRGHQAIYGVVIAAWAMGKVIDTEVLSKTSWIGMRNTKHSVKWITMVPRMQ